LNGIYSAIQSLKKVSDRAGEIAAMVDDMKSKDQLAAYRQEINQLLEQSVQIANTKNQYGYLFSGTKSDTASYGVIRNESGDIMSVGYNGSTTTAAVEIAPVTTISVHIPGSNKTGSGTAGLFETVNGSVFEDLIALRDGLAGGTQEDVKNIRENIVSNLMLDESAIIHHISRIGSLEARMETAKAMGTRRIDATQEFISRPICPLTPFEAAFPSGLEDVLSRSCPNHGLCKLKDFLFFLKVGKDTPFIGNLPVQ
ncbi:hypothetical protein N8622_01765, partial [bacterium]|nr:hypothetical protein [bacterium]